MENTVARIQDEESRFVVLTNEDYENKIEHQIARSSFNELPNNPNPEFEWKVKLGLISGSQIRLWATIGLNLLHENTPNQEKYTII